MSNKLRSFNFKMKLSAIAFAEANSIRAAAKKFNVDRKRIREWKSQKQVIEIQVKEEGAKRKRLNGGGRKLNCSDLDKRLMEWFAEMRAKSIRVSRKMIQVKAISLFQNLDGASDNFAASIGWLEKFLKRNKLTLRRRTTIAQKDPTNLSDKIFSYIGYVAELKKKYDLKNEDLIAMDETALCFDMISNTSVEQIGSRTVSIKGTGHEKDHFTVALAAKGDGTKLKPYIVFKGAKREVKEIMERMKSVVVVSNDNSWMNDTLTRDWLNRVYGRLAFKKQALIWDSYKCHLSDATKEHLKGFNTSMVAIPGGCTKYIQAADVSWNKPFKHFIVERYNEWMAEDHNKEYTPAGNMRPPKLSQLVQWVNESWNAISPELIKKSFKSCALTVHNDGSEDELITCLKDGRPCRPAWQLLCNYRDDCANISQDFFPVEEIDYFEDVNNESLITSTIEVCEGINSEEGDNNCSMAPEGENVEIAFEDNMEINSEDDIEINSEDDMAWKLLSRTIWK